MKNIPAIDGLRGWAVIFVLLLHSHNLFHGYLFGVPLFFLISGFLITNILLEKNYSFNKFILRRLARLLPASIIFTFILLTIYPLIPDGFKLSTIYGSFYGFLFIVNYAQILDLPYGWAGYFQHYWTLGLELQFYIIAYFIVRKYSNIILFFILLSLLFFYFYLYNNTPAVYFSNSIESNLFVFLFGSFASVFKIKYLNKISSSTRSRFINYFMVFLIFIQFFLIKKIPNIVLYLPFFCLFIFYILLIVKHDLNMNIILLTHPFILFIGKVSYSLYLYHFPIYHLVDEYLNFDIVFLSIFLKFSITFLFGIMSYFLVENPLRKNLYNKINNFNYEK